MSAGEAGGILVGEDALVDWGRSVGASLQPPVFITLAGPLGAGKSVLARAIARGLGVRGAVPSPTYNLMLRYAVPGGELVHLDLYRIADAEELWELGWQDLGESTEVVLVEWPERAGGLLPSSRWDVTLEPVPGRPSIRRVRADRVGEPAPLPALPKPAPGGRGEGAGTR